MKLNWRRAGGLLIGSALPIALIASLAFRDESAGLKPQIGLGFMIAAAMLAGVNAYLSFVRPRLIKPADQRHVSGLPLIGSVFVLVGVLLAFGEPVAALVGIVATAVDTGGLLWCVFALWRDASFWND